MNKSVTFNCESIISGSEVKAAIDRALQRDANFIHVSQLRAACSEDFEFVAACQYAILNGLPISWGGRLISEIKALGQIQ